MRKTFNKENLHKILLIDPKGFGAGLNLGLGYLAAVLLKNGYEVKVIDLNNSLERLSNGPELNLRLFKIETWKKKINSAIIWQPDVIGISINSFTLDNSIKVIKYCREKVGRKVICLAGGPHITIFQKEFLEKWQELFDFALVGESEETIIDLLKNIKKPQKVKGIIYYDRNKKKIIETQTRPLISDLDCLPFPNFKSFDTYNPKRGFLNYQMMSSRGCPYNCSFCFHMWTTKWRARSPENILAEIKSAQNKYHFKNLTFWDDNFNLDPDRVRKICDLFLAKNLKLTYDLAGIRADKLDEKLIKKLKQSGCRGICLGIEDGDPKTFPYVNKGETLGQIKKAVALIKKYKIPLMGYMVIGLINSSYKSFLYSLKFVEKLKVVCHWNIAFPFPKTLLYDWVKKNGRFLMSIEEGFKSSMTSKNPPVVFDTINFPREERLKAYYLGNLKSRGYDMLVSSRDSNFFFQARDIIEAIWKYDRQNIWQHSFALFKMFTRIIKKTDIFDL